MTVVVDIGCHTHESRPDHDSVRTLIDRHQPERLYGFDPHPAMKIYTAEHRDGTWVTLARWAAWTHDGTVRFDPSDGTPLSAHVRANGPLEVPCFDLAKWLHGKQHRVILKLDCEGAEYTLLEHLLDTDAVDWVDRVLVEWHGCHDGCEQRRAEIEWRLGERGIPVELW